MEEELYQVGVITQTHGIRGEVKVFPMTDDPSSFAGRKGLILLSDNEKILLDVERARIAGKFVILKFCGIDSINDIEKYKKCGLYVTRENRVALEEDEYFIADLIGLDVYCDEEDASEADADAPKAKARFLGKLTDVFPTGANDVYEVTLQTDKKILIPAIRDCILNVDITNGRMLVHLLPGLGE